MSRSSPSPVEPHPEVSGDEEQLRGEEGIPICLQIDNKCDRVQGFIELSESVMEQLEMRNTSVGLSSPSRTVVPVPVLGQLSVGINTGRLRISNNSISHTCSLA